MDIDVNLNLSFPRFMAKSNRKSEIAHEISSKDGSISVSSSSSPPSEPSGTPDLLRSVKTLREKVTRLETVRSITDEKIFRLMRATDNYSDLINQRPRFEDFDLSDSGSSIAQAHTVPKNDLLKDEGVRSAFDKLIRRVAHLENAGSNGRPWTDLVDHSTSVASLDHTHKSRSFADNLVNAGHASGSSHISDVERARGTAIAAHSFQDILGTVEPAISRNPSLLVDQKNRQNLLVPLQNDRSQLRSQSGVGQKLFVDSTVGEKNEDSRLNRSFGNDVNPQLNRSTTSSQSSLRPLSDVQVSKLKNFQESLRKEISRSQDQLGFSPPKRLADLEKESRQTCGRCGIPVGRCKCASTASVSKTTPLVPPLSLPLDERTEDRNVGRRGRSPIRKAHGTQTSFVWKPSRPATAFDKSVQTKVQNHKRLKRSSSVPASPMRRGSARERAQSSRVPPFVTGKSAGPSHSVLVNLQQLLALLKVQNPSLYHACRNLDEKDKSLTSLAEVFQRELTSLLRKRKNELKELLLAYDSLSTAAKSEPPAAVPDVKKRLKKLIHATEMKDTELQRLQKQLKMLIKLREELKMVEHNARPCQLIQIITSGFLDVQSPMASRNFAKPTASSRMKCASARVRSKSLGRTNEENVRALRDLKMVAGVLGAC